MARNGWLSWTNKNENSIQNSNIISKSYFKFKHWSLKFSYFCKPELEKPVIIDFLGQKQQDYEKR